MELEKFECSGAAPHEKAPEQRPLLAGDIAHPPEADLPHTQIALENAPSIELTEGQTSNMGSDAPERASWCHSHSVSLWSLNPRFRTPKSLVLLGKHAYNVPLQLIFCTGHEGGSTHKCLCASLYGSKSAADVGGCNSFDLSPIQGSVTHFFQPCRVAVRALGQLKARI